MQALTLDVIMRAVFGAREEPALRDVLRRALDMAGSLPRLVALSLVQRDLGPRSPWGRFMRAVRDVDDALRRGSASAARTHPARTCSACC